MRQPSITRKNQIDPEAILTILQFFSLIEHSKIFFSMSDLITISKYSFSIRPSSFRSDNFCGFHEVRVVACVCPRHELLGGGAESVHGRGVLRRPHLGVGLVLHGELLQVRAAAVPRGRVARELLRADAGRGEDAALHPHPRQSASLRVGGVDVLPADGRQGAARPRLQGEALSAADVRALRELQDGRCDAVPDLGVPRDVGETRSRLRVDGRAFGNG